MEDNQVVINAQPEVSDDQAAHEQKMMDVADGKIDAKTGEAVSESEPTVASRPDNIPEKFWNAETGEVNVEAMAKSYSELEKMKAVPTEETPEPEAEIDNGLEVPPLTGDNLMESLADHYEEHGELSDKHYEQLQEKFGFDRAFVDNYIAGQEAMAQSLRNQAFDIVGGEEKYSEMIQWASSNLTQSQIDALNVSLNSSDMEAVKLGVTSLDSLYTQANGKPADLLNGDNSAVTGTGFRSWNEVTAAMKDPRYGKDPAYTADVEQKISASNI